MPSTKRPRRGSMAYWPRKRAKRIYPNVKTWQVSKTATPLGFAGYKVGMTHVALVETNTNAKTKGQLISKPVTVVECPPLFVMGIRAYQDSLSCDVYHDKPSKNLSRKIKLPKEPKMDLSKFDGKKFDNVKLVCHTQPVFKKKPEVFEMALGGKPEEQLEFAKSILGKEIKIADIFKEGDYIDVVGVTIGKGFQGAVKRFGIRIQGRKNEQAHRKPGCHGQNEPGKIRPETPQPGQMGFHTRTEFNKRIIKIASGTDINPKGGFVNYGNVKNDYILIQGSIPGPKKRLIRMRGAVRFHKTKYPVDIKYISVESKQGV